MERQFERSLSSLDEVFAFINDFTNKHQLVDSIAYAINLTIEELFTNSVKYQQKSSARILISLDKSEDSVIACLTDYDVEPFDITEVHPDSSGMPPEYRRAGGMGLHLVKQMVDDIKYEYKNRTSKITITKQLQD